MTTQDKSSELLNLAHETFQASVSQRKHCKNNEAYTYTGREASPLGLGYTAQAEAVGTVREGRDKTQWIVCIRNDVHVWCRSPTPAAAAPVTTEAEVTVPVASSEPGPSVPVPKPKTTKKKVAEEKEVAATPKKTAAAAKKKKEEPVTGSEAPAAPVKKPLNSYNLFIKWRISKMTDVKPSERMGLAAKEWKAMSVEEKAATVEQARADIAAAAQE